MADENRSLVSQCLDIPDGTWVICSSCFRCYRAGEYAIDPDRGDQVCPCCQFGDCFDAIEWSSVRSGHPEFPEVPERDVMYRL